MSLNLNRNHGIAIGVLITFFGLVILVSDYFLATRIKVFESMNELYYNETINMMDEVREADEYTQLLLDSTPLSCILWDENGAMVNCNQEVMTLFGVDSKEEFYEKYGLVKRPTDDKGCGMTLWVEK